MNVSVRTEWPCPMSDQNKTKKKMSGKLCGDRTIQDAYQRYEITVHNVILDKVNQSLSQRFE